MFRQICEGADTLVDQPVRIGTSGPSRTLRRRATITPTRGHPVDVAYLTFDDMIRHVPIIDEFGHVRGIVSVRDMLRPLLIDALGGQPGPSPARTSSS